MKTGIARLCIDPPIGNPIPGYYEKRFVKGVLDHIYVHVAAFDDGKNRAAIISLDVLQLACKRCDMYRDAISKVTGIHRDALFVACTHTHTGPGVGGDTDNAGINDEEYEKLLIEKMCEATRLALDDVVFAGLPGEPFVEIGRESVRVSPFSETYVCALTNGGDTYFPSSRAYDKGGYEARTSRLKKGGDKIIVDGMKKLYKKLQ